MATALELATDAKHPEALGYDTDVKERGASPMTASSCKSISNSSHLNMLFTFSPSRRAYAGGVYASCRDLSRKGVGCQHWDVSLAILHQHLQSRMLTPHSETPPEKSGLDIDDELITARRALRTASWAAIFYLITTDILGPFNAPFAFSQVGYVPGAILYVVSEYFVYHLLTSHETVC